MWLLYLHKICMDSCEVGRRLPVAQDSRQKNGNAFQSLATLLPAHHVREVVTEGANYTKEEDGTRRDVDQWNGRK